MDFVAVGLQKCIVIPTPGQTEQEYLAKHLAEQGRVVFAKQQNFQLRNLISQVITLKGFDIWEKNDLLEKEISRWLGTFLGA
jgi:hypothetical protein